MSRPRFQPGEMVKVHYQRYKDQPPTDHPGEYIGTIIVDFKCGDGTRRSETRHNIKIYGQTLIFENHQIYTWKPISDEEIEKFGNENVKKLAELILEGMKELIPDKHHASVTIDENSVVVRGSWGMTVSPTAIENHGIGSIVEVPGWVVETPHVISNYPHAPDEVDLEEHGRYRTNEQAAGGALSVLWGMISEYHWRLKSDVAMADEWERDEKLAKEYFSGAREDTPPEDV